MEVLAKEAIERGLALGASYVDARVERIASESLVVRNDRLTEVAAREEFGLAVRAWVDGAFGFAAAPLALEDAATARALAERAVRLGRILAPARARRAAWSALDPQKGEPAVGEYATPVAIDPFALSDAEKLEPLRAACAALGGQAGVTAREATFACRSRRQWFASSEGAAFHQELVRTGAGIAATAAAHGEVAVRSWPASYGGDHQPGGFERVREFELVHHAPRVRDEALALAAAPTCTAGVRDVVLSSNLVMLVIHETVGHATELDRVLGAEADLAGHSFADVDARGVLVYGSPWVSLHADSRAAADPSEHGLDTRGIDDEGVRAERWSLVHAGRFVDFQSSRETAHALGSRPSHGCARAASWYHPPIVRITNVSLAPGAWDFDALVRDTGDGLLLDGVKTWSIDEARRNFQFTAELGWELVGGEKRRLVRTPTFTGDTLGFWRSCDAVCSPAHFRMWGITNCGKGNPVQDGEMSHGAAPARFRGVRILAG